MWDRKNRDLVLALVVASPLFTFPLSWLPRAWLHFRYDCVVPLPEMLLAGSVLLGGIHFFRRAFGAGISATDVGSFVSPWAIAPVLAVLATAIISMRCSERPYFGIGLLPRLFGNAVVFFLAASAPRESIVRMCKLWIAVAVLVAVNGLVRLRSEPQFLSTLGNWNFLGVYLAASLVIGARIGGVWPSLVNVILLVAMLFCRSRGAWLALGAVSLLWFVIFGDRLLRRWPIRVVAVISLLVVAGSLAWPYAHRQWQTDVRPMIWNATLRMIVSQPLVGHGLGTYVSVYPRYRLPQYFLRPKATNVTDHAHNELLEIAAEQGFPGLAARLWLWGLVVWCGLRASRSANGREASAILGLSGAALVFMLHGLVDVDLRHLPNQTLLWLLMGLLVGTGTTPSRLTTCPVCSKALQLSVAVACFVAGIAIVSAAVIQPIAADWLDREARLAEERGDLHAAAGYASRALELQPFRLSTRYLLAGALAGSPDPTSRRMAIDQGLQLEDFAPDYGDVTFNLGELYLADSQVTNALPLLQRTVEINPYNANRHVALAIALRDLGKNEGALEELRCALELQPDNQAATALMQDILRKNPP
jgi:tetratricopeptide (TPR) repeat protein